MKDNYIHSNWSRHVMFFREQFLRSSEHESMVKLKIIVKLQSSVCYHNIFISVLFSSEKSPGVISHGYSFARVVVVQFSHHEQN